MDFGSHMVWEGMVLEGLAVTRAIHDRHHARLRNPYNEIECSDHYARAMASYGTLLAACGFEYHGRQGRLGFAPRIAPEDFRAAFTTAEGWGTFAQKRTGDQQQVTLALRWGRLRLRRLSFVPAGGTAPAVRMRVNGTDVAASFTTRDGKVEIAPAREIEIKAPQQPDIAMTLA